MQECPLWRLHDLFECSEKFDNKPLNTHTFANLPSNPHAFSNAPLGVLIFFYFIPLSLSHHFLIFSLFLFYPPFSDCFTPGPTYQVRERERFYRRRGSGRGGDTCALILRRRRLQVPSLDAATRTHCQAPPLGPVAGAATSLLAHHPATRCHRPTSLPHCQPASGP